MKLYEKGATVYKTNEFGKVICTARQVFLDSWGLFIIDCAKKIEVVEYQGAYYTRPAVERKGIINQIEPWNKSING